MAGGTATADREEEEEEEQQIPEEAAALIGDEMVRPAAISELQSDMHATNQHNEGKESFMDIEDEQLVIEN